MGEVMDGRIYIRNVIKANEKKITYYIFQLLGLIMFRLVRKVVAGPKRTTKYEGQDLDLTYITERIIAMAFPASHFIEQTYRNKIEDVANYLAENHKEKYLIFNVSSRSYDYDLFQRRVKEFQWPDHQAPSLTTLFSVAYQMFLFLSKDTSNVVVVHCNHGKGRTGTAIIAFFLLIGYSQSASECLRYYNFKRFNKQTYGVDQPCQVRYLAYIQKLVKANSIRKKLKCLLLKDVTHKGLDSNYYVRVKSTRTQQSIYQRIYLNNHITQVANKFLISDIFIELFVENWMGEKRVSRINYNLYFLQEDLRLTLKGSHIKLQSNHSQQFEITLTFQYHCLCHLPAYHESCCNCNYWRSIQELEWRKMINSINKCKQLTQEDISTLAHGYLENNTEEIPQQIISLDQQPKTKRRKNKTNRQKKILNFVEKRQARRLLINNFI